MTKTIDTPLPRILKFPELNPIAAEARPAGVSLVPKPRPLAQGGIADLLAMRRHHRREQRRNRAA